MLPDRVSNPGPLTYKSGARLNSLVIYGLRHRVKTIFSSPLSCCSKLIKSGPSCSKLTTSLVNVSLKFQMLISEMCQYFLLKKCVKLLQCKSFSHFSTKNISIFSNKVVKHFTS